jgi:hypothetical protein
MNMTKVLCLSLLTLTGSSLAGVAFAGQTWPSEFLDQATTILGHLLPAFEKNPTGVRISYAARCDAGRAAPLIPSIRLQKASRSNTVLEAARSAFSGDNNVIVSRDDLDNVRIEIGNVPDALLRTNIATLRLDEQEQYNPLDAIIAIKATKEMQKAAAALHLKPSFTLRFHPIQRPSPGAPHLPSVLQNLTVDQILDMLAARFKGAVLYGVCTQGPQPRQFLIHFLDNYQWS